LQRRRHHLQLYLPQNSHLQQCHYHPHLLPLFGSVWCNILQENK
jgi:hypothetical protein